MKKLTVLLLVFCLLLSLTACGATANKNAVFREESAAVAAPMMAADSAAGLTTNGSAPSASVPEGRKWIITVDMSVETEDLETLQETLTQHIEGMDGYVEDQSIYNGSTYASRRYRNANLTIRIPADRIDSFTKEVDAIANVVSNNLRREDVTLQYVDTEGRVKALKIEETRLLELLAAAESMSDLLEIEARLSDVRYELESYTSQLRTLDNQIDYATVYLFIEEVQEYTPVEEPTLWERITDGFADSIEGLGESLQDLLVFLIVAIPYMLVYGGAVILIFLLVRKIAKTKIVKKSRKSSATTEENP